MFTGIIEDKGKVKKIARAGRVTQLLIESKKVSKGHKVGESISVNGVCLTSVKMNQRTLTFELQNETLRCTGLGGLRVHDLVNLERALPLTGRLNGHIVQGHVDEVGKLLGLEHQKKDVLLKIKAPKTLMPFIVPKGSIALNGVSLTVVKVNNRTFTVHLIPHTLKETTFEKSRIGDNINLEVDILAKYVHFALSSRE